MNALLRIWRQIGTRLYLALALAVVLTLLSSAVGIYYFERSGDLNYRIRAESAPAVDAAWNTAFHVHALNTHGREITMHPGATPQREIGDILTDLDESLSWLSSLDGMEVPVWLVQNDAYKVAGTIDQIAAYGLTYELAHELDTNSGILDESTMQLLGKVDALASANLDATVGSFDQGRLLLAVISISSVVLAGLVAWIWVGNGILRRLARVSNRMRGMANGDLVTPVPETGRDEIGQLAGALEVFRQHALEVQRLNLVEKYYNELHRTYAELEKAHAELETMQARLVAQEKLAALGELVSGVAHEISNPLNFVKNFSEGTQDLYSELTEMLDTYRDNMNSEDVALLDDITQEISDSLTRVITNGGRALTIVERMQSLSVDARLPQNADLNRELRNAVVSACMGHEITPSFALDENIGSVMITVEEFKEAIGSLATNACNAMDQKKSESVDEYEPALLVSSFMVGESVEIRVRDNGTGIAEDVLPRIFNPFFTTQDGAVGAGLGLTIAADIARRAGGDLQVDTVHGNYTEFLMTMPVSRIAPSDDEND